MSASKSEPDNAVRRLLQTSSQLEVWWDSSPLHYPEWAGEGSRPELFRMDGRGRFGKRSLLQGSTTNQPLTWNVIEKDPETWRDWLRRQAGSVSGMDAREAMWRLFIEVARRGAEMLSPIFRASGGRRGQICCQVDPRDLTDHQAIVAQARRIHAAHPAIMVKVPGSREGIQAVRTLTAEGIPTNVTLGFTVSQLLATGEAAREGLREAEARGTDLSGWRSCAVMMLGRYEDAPPLEAQAERLGVRLSEADKRWAGIAIFRRAHRLFRERGYPSKLMAASMRAGPTVDGVQRVWHLEKLAGASAVLTVFPNILESFLDRYAELPLEAQIEEPVPEEVLARLLRIPYFLRAYQEEGIPPERWVDHEALQATARSFSEAMEKIERFAGQAISGPGA